jgi:hypothetical protein
MTSTIIGIGMVSGRAIKSLGQGALDLVENQVIRRRLRSIRLLLAKEDAFARMKVTDQSDLSEELIELSG